MLARSLEMHDKFKNILNLEDRDFANEIGIPWPNFRDIRFAVRDRLPTITKLYLYEQSNRRHADKADNMRPFDWVYIITGEDRTPYERHLEKRIAELEKGEKLLHQLKAQVDRLEGLE